MGFWLIFSTAEVEVLKGGEGSQQHGWQRILRNTVPKEEFQRWLQFHLLRRHASPTVALPPPSLLSWLSSSLPHTFAWEDEAYEQRKKHLVTCLRAVLRKPPGTEAYGGYGRCSWVASDRLPACPVRCLRAGGTWWARTPRFSTSQLTSSRREWANLETPKKNCMKRRGGTLDRETQEGPSDLGQ